MKFHQTVETEFLPAIKRNDKEASRAIAVGSLEQSFEEHRGYVDEVVDMAQSQSHGAEREASRLITQRSSILLALAGGILLTVLSLGVMLSRRIFSASQALEREIVDRKRAENDLRESEALRRETLRRSHDLQSALLHSISHDLHSPLASIDGSAILMAETDAIEERQEHARQIQIKSHSMLTLVDNLLDMLRLEAGVLKPRCEWQFLEEVIDTAVQRCNNIMNGRQLKVVRSADLPALFIDGVLILQVLTNLIDNAVKYSFPNSVIEMETHIVGQTVEVSVSNEGEGIPSDQIEDLFRPFYRGTNIPHDAPTKTGSGLGLAICKGIVEAHDGSIRIRSGPSGKTSIRFSLPILEQGHSILDEQHPVVESFHFTLSTEQA
jgi:two-component system sensor histidine kinase KdpD